MIDFFELAMKYRLAEPLPVAAGVVLNLGAGKQVIPGATPLAFEFGWDGDKDPIPYEDESVDGVHAYHFLEHLHDPLFVLKEIQRVLKPGGVFQICVPHYLGAMAFQDLDHKHFFTTETWKTLFDNQRYNKWGVTWRYRVHLNVIMALNERNIALLTQLVKV